MARGARAGKSAKRDFHWLTWPVEEGGGRWAGRVMYFSHSAGGIKGMACTAVAAATILPVCRLDGHNAVSACAAWMTLGFTVFTKMLTAFCAMPYGETKSIQSRSPGIPHLTTLFHQLLDTTSCSRAHMLHCLPHSGWPLPGQVLE